MNIELTVIEQSIVSRVVSTCVDIMETDEILSEGCEQTVYSDGGNFLLSLTEEEMTALISAHKKL